MDTTTRAGRVAMAHQLRTALHRMPGNVLPDPDTETPRGNCGDPETLNYSGTLQQRRQQLRAARRGLRL
jgi:hypothetical protein